MSVFYPQSVPLNDDENKPIKALQISYSLLNKTKQNKNIKGCMPMATAETRD